MNKHSFWRGKISIMLTLALLVSVIFVPVPKVKAAGEVTTVTIKVVHPRMTSWLELMKFVLSSTI